MPNVSKKAIFHLILGFLPPAVGKAVSAAEAVAASGADKKSKAVADVSIALQALNELAGTDLSTHPKFVDAVGKVNDAVHNAAKVAQQLTDAAQPQK